MRERLGTTLLLLAAGASPLAAQELEPRAYTNAPIGMDFFIVGYGFIHGDVLVDATSPVEDARLTSHTLLLAYARSLKLGSDAGKVDVLLPYGSASGNATLGGQTIYRDIGGFADPSVRLSWNFHGAPALTLPEFQTYRPNWVVGASLRVSVPLGQYDESKLLNIGTNRFTFKPELGVSKTWRRWTFEMATSASLFTDNDEYLGTQHREQDAVFAQQVHVIRSFDKGFWAGLDATYYTGGRSTVDGVENDDEQSSSRAGLTVAIAVNPRNTVKLYASTGTTARVGGDFDSAGAAWQIRRPPHPR